MFPFIKQFARNFLRCGLTGWCFEILFTAMESLRRRNFKLTGTTSLWMFPIYGCAAIIAPISRMLNKHSLWMRGFTYMTCIFVGEYLSGQFLRKHALCPWDYTKSYHNIHGNIRLDYAPLWFGAGLFFEKLLSSDSSPSQQFLR